MVVVVGLALQDDGPRALLAPGERRHVRLTRGAARFVGGGVGVGFFGSDFCRAEGWAPRPVLDCGRERGAKVFDRIG